MTQIVIEKNPSQAKLDHLNVFRWPIWEKEVSRFPWSYDAEETCYLLEGEVIVTPEGGEAVHFSACDLVIFPAGLSCIWDIKQAVKKHYSFA